jgi:hypothetical protein
LRLRTMRPSSLSPNFQFAFSLKSEIQRFACQSTSMSS